MLTHVFVKNLAVVAYLSLDLTDGMTVITGETGAGKSMLIDALSLAFGERADTRAIRPDCEKAEISLTFDLSELPQVQSWLQDNELDTDGECITRRILVRDGRSKAYINGRPTPIGALKILGEMMIDIHSQHAHQLLLKREVQLNLLDDFGDLHNLVTQTGALYAQFKHISQHIDELNHKAEQESARMALLSYQIQELEELAPTAGELQALHDEQHRLANAEQRITTGQQALLLLYTDEEHAIYHQLNQVNRQLESLSACDSTLDDTTRMVADALIAVNEASSNLRHYLEAIEIDPQRLSWIDTRIASIQAIARKHQIAPEQIDQHLHTLQQEKGAFVQIEQSIATLREEKQRISAQYQDIAARVSEQRKRVAQALSARVSRAVRPLGMPHAVFSIDVTQTKASFSATGWDQVNFLVSANKGQPPQPLNKVASGGELSRISLAIQVEAARYAKIPTLVFDEVDVGIGGGVAEVVGKLIRTLGENRQVICITHLPQVACQGHHHLKVTKTYDQQSTQTQIDALTPTHRVTEIARMLGGVELTEQTLAHAEEMLRDA